MVKLRQDDSKAARKLFAGFEQTLVSQVVEEPLERELTAAALPD